MALVRAQGIEGNETGQEASVRAEVAGTGAQCSGFPYVGEKEWTRGSRLSQRSNSMVRIPGRGSGKEPGSKARPQKVRITVTGSQQ